MRALWLLILVAACASESHPDRDRGGEPTSDERRVDTEGDGLCDETEADRGTDPMDPDTDGDGLPDLIEVGYALHPTDPAQPGVDQVAFLMGSPGAVLDFDLRTTVDGLGESHTGSFSDLPSFYDGGPSAADFFVAAFATSAEPPDNVRGVVRDAGRFDSVLGETRLGFSLRFEFGDSAPFACTRAYAFRWALKSDSGEQLGARIYLLVVTAEDADLDRSPWCHPTHCL